MAKTASKAFIQARMNSTRFPGKSLAPLASIPLIERVIESVANAVPRNDIVVLTTDQHPEEPLVSYVEEMDIEIWRGHPTNVFQRFQSAISQYPCECFYRICGDNPFLDPRLLEYGMDIYQKNTYDVVTNMFTRDFPPGLTVELIDSSCFMSVQHETLNEQQKEHVTKYFYDNPDNFSIYDIECSVASEDQYTFAVNTIEDLKMLEEKVDSGSINFQKYRDDYEA